MGDRREGVAVVSRLSRDYGVQRLWNSSVQQVAGGSPYLHRLLVTDTKNLGRPSTKITRH